MREINFTEEEVLKLKQLINLLHPKPQEKYKIVSLSRITSVVCAAHNISKEDLIGPKRNQQYIMARVDFVHLAYKFLTKNKTKLARSIGKKHNFVVTNLLKKTPSHHINKIISILF